MSPSDRDLPSAEARRSLGASDPVPPGPLAAARGRRARGLSRLPAAGGGGHGPSAGGPGRRPHRGRAVLVRDSQVLRGDRQRGRVAGAQRPAGLSLQPHRLRLGTRRRALVLRRAGARRAAGSRSAAGGGGRAGEPGSIGDRVSHGGGAATTGPGDRHPLPGRDALARGGRRRRAAGRARPAAESPARRRRARRFPGTPSSPSPI